MQSKSKGVAFYEGGSWYHRTKIFNENDGTTRYSKKGGFTSAEEAEKSSRKYEEAYAKAYRAYHIIPSADIFLKEYLVWWLDEIYTPRIENTTRMLASYVLYDLLLPNMSEPIKLRHINVEYLDALLARVAKSTESAGNKCRELLNIALKDALIQGYVTTNPMPLTQPYRRKKTKIVVLTTERLKFFLKCASEDNWYLEILLALFLGLRKGEISGLKFSDFNFEESTVTIERQITSNPIVEKGSSKITEYRVIEKEPKTTNSYRTLRVPPVIMNEVLKRKHLIDDRKEQMEADYIDGDYISCSKNGLPHSTASFNTALTKLCSRNGLPHLTPHSLRHMFATILLEKGVPLVKVSALLGHASCNTTFEYYCEVMDENEKIINFINDNFVPGGE